MLYVSIYKKLLHILRIISFVMSPPPPLPKRLLCGIESIALSALLPVSTFHHGAQDYRKRSHRHRGGFDDCPCLPRGSRVHPLPQSYQPNSRGTRRNPHGAGDCTAGRYNGESLRSWRGNRRDKICVRTGRVKRGIGDQRREHDSLHPHR